MPTRIRTITIDCRDPYGLAEFWALVTDYAEDPDEPNVPGDDEAFLAGPDGAPGLLFVTVPEHKSVKNRMHVDIVPDKRTRDAEIAYLVGLGARMVDDRRETDGTGWAVLADPEGNEFCVERSDAEREA
ncbi:VOC family protein [Microbacteriaceae bacterium VKM Ac-2855]|nr:VOC family protein [Microbacteriaceae bacterium VKM Ac-2855]